MLIKFFPNGQGRGSGPVGYLIADQVLAYDANRNLIRDEAGALVRSVEAAQPGRTLSVQVADGSFGVTVAGGETGGAKPAAPRPVRKGPASGSQGDLF